jgi:hypothetical protein
MRAWHTTAVAVLLSLTSPSPTYSQATRPPDPPRLLAASATVFKGPARDAFVATHNAARKPLDLEPLTWSDNLAAVALESLKRQQETLIKTAQDGWTTGQISLPSHRQDHQYGENIAAWASSSSRPADYAVALWLREKPAFDLLNSLGTYRVGDELPPQAAPAEKQPPPMIVGHYTQIIWRATRELGAAELTFELTHDGRSRHYTAIICNYAPPGNRHGQPPY